MDFKFKEEILLDIGPESNCNYESESNRYYDKIHELDRVYAQAAEYKEYRADTEKLYNALKAKGEREILKYKVIADEYEAKAKAFEKVAGIAYWYFERVNPEYADFSDYEGFYDDIKDEFKKLESGESDV